MVTLATGQRGYHKPVSGLDDEVAADFGHGSPQQPVHEVATWRIAKALGPPWDQMVAPTVLREVDGQVGSLSLNMPGGPVPRVLFSGGDRRTANDYAQWRAAGFFDCLTGQQDRHFRNARYRDGGGLSLIDHGFAFAEPGDVCNRSVFQRLRTESDDPTLTGHERQVLQRLRSDSTLAGTAAFLEPGRVTALRVRLGQMLAQDRVLELPNRDQEDP